MVIAQPRPRSNLTTDAADDTRPSSLVSSAELLGWYRLMLMARGLSDRIWLLNRQGKVHIAVTCHGHEAAQIGSAVAFRGGLGICVTYYRDLAVMLILGMTPRVIMLNALAKKDDPNSGGRQMPGHWSWPEQKVFTQSSSVATQIPHAVGMVLAAKVKNEPSCAIVYFGDGAVSNGDFHEGVHFAAIHRLPVVFFCENNKYAISVPSSLQSATPTVAEKAAAYGIPGVTVDGQNILAVYDATVFALERARRGDGPTLLEALVPRLTPHTSSDDEGRYRTPEELEQARSADPIPWFGAHLKRQRILNQAVYDTMRLLVDQEVEEATEFAERSPDPEPEDLYRDLFFSDAGT